MAVQKTTGRSGSATIRGQVISITKWEAKSSKNLADATASDNYDSTSGQLWQSQAVGAIGMEVTIEGNFDLAGTTDAQFVQWLKMDPPADVLLYITPTVRYCEGLFDMSDVSVSLSVPGGTMVTYSATLKSNGAITLF